MIFPLIASIEIYKKDPSNYSYLFEK